MVAGVIHGLMIIQVLLFDLAIEKTNLSQWLKSNQIQRKEQVGSVLEDINIGLSCSSESMRLSDEVVSIHAATFVDGFRKFSLHKPTKRPGVLQINSYSEIGDVLFNSHVIEVLPIIKQSALNDPKWQIRLQYGLDKQMKQLLNKSFPNETGGILIGLVNFNRRIIYVTRVLPAPPDSTEHPYAFIRGTKDIPEKVYGNSG
jgi:hypothetical protein